MTKSRTIKRSIQHSKQIQTPTAFLHNLLKITRFTLPILFLTLTYIIALKSLAFWSRKQIPFWEIVVHRDLGNSDYNLFRVFFSLFKKIVFSYAALPAIVLSHLYM